MSTHKAGFGFEDRLIGYLTRQQFTVGHDTTLDHDYKIDFVISKFPNNPKFHSMGIQVTTRLGEIQKLQEFANVHSNEYRVVDKVMYLEVDPSLDFEKGVGHLISTGISEFQFNTKHQNDKMAGLKINSDMTYSIFDIASTLAILAKDEHQSRSLTSLPVKKTIVPALNPKEQKKPTLDVAQAVKSIQNGLQGGLPSRPAALKLQGFINAYYRTRDHGFITAQTGEPYFFSLMGVADGELRDSLLALPQIDWGASVEGTIEFEDAGKTRPNARYPEAKVVRFSK